MFIFSFSDVFSQIGTIEGKITDTDEQGQFSVSIPWNGQFVIEIVYTKETPGAFQGDDYEPIRHPATYSIPAR